MKKWLQTVSFIVIESRISQIFFYFLSFARYSKVYSGCSCHVLFQRKAVKQLKSKLMTEFVSLIKGNKIFYALNIFHLVNKWLSLQQMTLLV